MINLKGLILAAVMSIAAVGPSVAGEYTQIGSVTGMNGVRIDQALIIGDQRDGTISLCTPTGNDAFPYACATTDMMQFLQALTPCGIATVENHGPELLCQDYWEHWKEHGVLPGQTAL